MPSLLHQQDIKNNPEDPFNLALVFRKFPLCVQNRNEVNFKITDWSKKIAGFQNGKLYLSNNMQYYNAFRSQIEALLNYFEKKEGYVVKMFDFQANWRILLDLGTPSVYENGLNIFKFDAYPRISGSAIKGILKQIFNRYEGNKEMGKISRRLLGNPSNSGKLVCFDAYPVVSKETKEPIYSLDVMNPHYSEYYNNPEQKTPGDWWNPNPIIFLAIEPLKWRFSFLFEKDNNDKNDDQSSIINFLNLKFKDMLHEGLKYIGIGAKTNSGYGLFL
jgi:CRISPR-associated protein Cmr6